MYKNERLLIFFCCIILIFTVLVLTYPVEAGRPPYTIKIMPLGDSITYGYTDGSLTNDFSVAYRQKLYLDLVKLGYKVDFVGSLLSGQSATPFFDYDHEGHPGYEKHEVANKIFDWLTQNPADIVLLHIGTNNINPDSFYVEKILNEIDRYSLDVIVVIARIINRIDNSQKSSLTTQLNDNVEFMALDRIAKEGDKILIVDQERALNYNTDLAPDGFHPNENGYMKMADVWLNGLLSLYEDNIGTFRKGAWFLDNNGNDLWDKDFDTKIPFGSFGLKNDLPVTGDWNGNGIANIGVFRNGAWFLDDGDGKWNSAKDTTIKAGSFGFPDDIPITGDWNGDGKTNIGVFRKGAWYLDYNGNNKWDKGLDKAYSAGSFGLSTDIPITGDWNGDGKTKIGVYRKGAWYLDFDGNGQWNKNKDTTVLAGSFGLKTDIPVTGDWNGDGKTNIGYFRKGAWYLDFNGNNKLDFGDIYIPAGSFGLADDIPIVGLWKKKPF